MREVSVIETLGKNRRCGVLADTDFRVVARVFGKRAEIICGYIELAHFHMFGAAEKFRRESVCQTRRRKPEERGIFHMCGGNQLGRNLRIVQ